MSHLFWGVLSVLTVAAQADEPAVVYTTAQIEMIQALSVRHDPPTCHELEKLSSEPLADLLVLVHEVKQPAWVGMRAAGCVVQRHGAEAEPELVRWVTSSDTLGLARLVASSIDALPPQVAVRVAGAGLEGVHREDQRARLASSTLPEVRALLK